jgi:hypothetical protein
MPVRVGSSEGLGVSVDLCTTNNFTISEYVNAETSPANPALDHGWCRKRFAAKSASEDCARLAKLDAPQLDSANGELAIQKIVQSNATGHEVPARERQIWESSLLGAEALNLLGLHKREVLSWVPADTKVSVTDNAHPARK